MLFSWLFPFHGLDSYPPAVALIALLPAGAMRTVNTTRSEPATSSGMQLTNVDLKIDAGRQTGPEHCRWRWAIEAIIA